MRKLTLAPWTLSTLLLVSPLGLAQDERLPAEGGATGAPAGMSSPVQERATSDATGTESSQGAQPSQESSATGPAELGMGMGRGRPGAGGCPRRSMRDDTGMGQRGQGMGRGMVEGGGMDPMGRGMGSMRGAGASEGGMPMGKGMGKSGKQGCRGGMGMKHGMMQGMHDKHRKLVARLDVLEAQLAKIELMLERLLAR